MDVYLLIAGILCFVLGVAHSLLGELLIFKDKRVKGALVPSKEITGLKERHLRIIWATWHLATVFGWCIGAILIKISLKQNELPIVLVSCFIQIIIYTMFMSGFLVLIGSKGKHPGWIVLLIIGILLVIGT